LLGARHFKFWREAVAPQGWPRLDARITPPSGGQAGAGLLCACSKLDASGASSFPLFRRCAGQNRTERLQVLVRDNNVDQALKALKKKMQREGIFREMKLRGHYEKPSEKRAREKAEAVRRARKLARKKMQREGLLPTKPKPVPGVAAR
jgi:small subunit ribosomal protein S21